MRRLQKLFLEIVPPILAVLLLIWGLDNTPPTELYSTDVVPRSVEPGAPFKIRFRGIINRVCPVVSSEEVIDADGTVWPIVARLGRPTRKRGPFDTQSDGVLPLNAARGPAIYRSVAAYGVDFLAGCFQAHTVGPPKRPEARFWIGKMPDWKELTAPKGRP